MCNTTYLRLLKAAANSFLIAFPPTLAPNLGFLLLKPELDFFLIGLAPFNMELSRDPTAPAPPCLDLNSATIALASLVPTLSLNAANKSFDFPSPESGSSSFAPAFAFLAARAAFRLAAASSLAFCFANFSLIILFSSLALL